MPWSRLTIFALLTAWANLLHQLSYPEWIKGGHPIGWAVFVVSLAGIIRPQSFPLLVGLLILRVAYTAAWIPMIRGHLFLEGLFATGILALLAAELWRRRSWGPVNVAEEESFFESFAPLLRATTLIVYGAVTLSKLNLDFVDPQKSAAVQLLRWTEEVHQLAPAGRWLRQASIWATFAFEAGIPILLCVRRTRWLGIVLGLAFHAALGLMPLKIASFSLTMCLLLFSWMPRESGPLIFDGINRLSRALALTPRRLNVLLAGLAAFTGLAFAFRHGFGPQVRAVDFGLGLWWWQCGIMAVALWWVRNAEAQETRALVRQSTWFSRLFIGVLVFNCLCPYLGLKTRTTLTMHCNLRTELGFWNHLLLPESMRIFRFQDDLVTILESDLADLKFLADQKMPLPYFEFRRWCRIAEGDFFVRYRRGENPPESFVRDSRSAATSELMKGSRLLEWLLCFNPVGASHDYIPALVRRVGPARNIVPEIPADSLP